MKNRMFVVTAIASIILLFSGCMGSFETARVVPLKVGATYFATIDAEDDNAFIMPGIIIETGLPAAPARFGIGLHLRTAVVIKSEQNDDNDDDDDAQQDDADEGDDEADDDDDSAGDDDDDDF